MAHALDFHHGKCKNIHGHSYSLAVTLLGEPKINDTSDKGMVMDFAFLKDIVETEIIKKLDHALMLHSQSKYLPINNEHQKLVVVDYQPTCENMIGDFARRLSVLLPDNVELVKLKLTETATSFAEWLKSDNL